MDATRGIVPRGMATTKGTAPVRTEAAASEMSRGTSRDSTARTTSGMVPGARLVRPPLRQRRDGPTTSRGRAPKPAHKRSLT